MPYDALLASRSGLAVKMESAEVRDTSTTFSCRAFALIVVLSLAAIALSRAPFLPNVLMGEEGTHSYLVLGPTPIIKGDNALYIARINGDDIVGFASRNLLAYQFLDVIVRRIIGSVPFCRDTSFWCISVHARSAFLILFLAATVAMLLGLRSSLTPNHPWTLALQALSFSYVLSAPLLVGGSIQPQLDGALGALVVSSAAALLLSTPRPGRSRDYLAGFLGGAVAALVKNEWAIALAAAVFAAALLALLANRLRSVSPDGPSVRRVLMFCGTILLGIAACQLALFAYAPSAFLSGLYVMYGIAGMQTGIIETLIAHRVGLFPIFVTCAAALLLLLHQPWMKCIEYPGLVIVTLWAAAIAGGYIFSGYGGDGFLRYYVPAGVLALMALVPQLARLHLSAWLAAPAGAVLFFGVVANLRVLENAYVKQLSITSLATTSMVGAEKRYAAEAKKSRETGLPVLDGSAIGIYYRDIDWVAIDLGEQGAIDLLRKLRPDGPAQFIREGAPDR